MIAKLPESQLSFIFKLCLLKLMELEMDQVNSMNIKMKASSKFYFRLIFDPVLDMTPIAALFSIPSQIQLSKIKFKIKITPSSAFLYFIPQASVFAENSNIWRKTFTI